MIKYCIALFVAYLAGAVNPAILLSKKYIGEDIRHFGSGNPGSTNVQRVMGNKMALLNALLDMLKTSAAIFFAQWFLCGGDWEKGIPLRLAAGVLASIGHAWPIWHHFRGGKCVMTSATTGLWVSPPLFGIAVAVFLCTVAFTKYISLGSLLSVGSFAFLMLFTSWERPLCPLLAFLLWSLVLLRHRENIKRLLAGTERKIKFGKKEEQKK